MAHGDYNCCALCDCKMDYNAWGATTKEEICEDCMKAIKELGLNITNVEELKDFIENADYEKVKKFLLKCDFCFCFYWNEIDKSVWYRFFKKRDSFKNLIEKEKE